jgi:hypothetical protein
MPHVASANSAGKAAVLPRVIEVIAGITRARVVPDPFAIGVNVWCIGVPGRVAIVLRLRSGSAVGFSRRLGRALRGDIMPTCIASVFSTLALFVLGPSRNRKHQQHHENSTESLHVCLLQAIHCNASQVL